MRTNEFLTKAIRVLFTVLIVWTVFLLVAFHETADVFSSRDFLIEDGGFLILGTLVVFFLYRLNKKAGISIEEFLKKHHRFLLVVSLAILLGWQLYACFGGYFSTGWDAQVIRETVFHEAEGDYQAINHGYFSWFPNNVLLVWIYKQIVTVVDRTVGVGLEYSMVAFQCLLDVITVYLTYRIALDLFHSYRAAWLTFVVAYLFVGLSPWFIIVYSDATGIVLPVLLIRLYQLGLKSDSKRKSILLFLLLGFFAMAGYYLKPQIFITAIAMVLVSALGTIGKGKKDFGTVMRHLLYSGAGVVLFLGIYHAAIVPSLHFDVNKDHTIGWQYYVMMGLNDQTDGAFLIDDYDYTYQFETNAERNTADLQIAKERLSAYGITGMVRHLSRKELLNYGDGTFAWGMEGGFFLDIPFWANNSVSGFMHEVLFPEGKLFMAFTSFKQLIWVTILAMCMFAGKRKWNPEESGSHDEQIESVILLALIGLTVFELIFEARARYLFCYAPVFILTALMGTRNLFHHAGSEKRSI